MYPFIQELSAEFTDKVQLCDFGSVVSQCDVLSIHVPLTEKTRNLFKKDTLQKMKKGAFLINTARGGIVHEQDLYDCLKSGHLSGAALDVSESEPVSMDNPLLTLDNVVMTPHIGMYSQEALHAVSLVCAKNMVKKFTGETPDYLVV